MGSPCCANGLQRSQQGAVDAAKRAEVHASDAFNLKRELGSNYMDSKVL